MRAIESVGPFLACYGDFFGGIEKGLYALIDSFVQGAILVAIVTGLGLIAGLVMGAGQPVETGGERVRKIGLGALAGASVGLWVGFFGACAVLGVKLFLAAQG